MHRRLLAAVLLAAALVVTGCASAASGITGAKGEVLAFAKADLERARAIAVAADDVAGVACATALLKHVPDGGAAVLEPSGVFSVFMKARALRRTLSAGVNEEIHIACAPLILDAQVTVAKLGLMAVPGGGVLGGLLRR